MIDTESMNKKINEELPWVPANLSGTTALVTHVNCMDGAACAILFLEKGGLPEDIYYVGAGSLKKFIDENPVMKSDKFIIFADVGLTNKEEADVLEERGECVLLDHHLTSAHMKDRHWAYIDCEGNGGTGCGCMLLCHYLGVVCDLGKDEEPYSPEMIRFVTAVDDNDRWLQKDPRSMDMACWMTFVGQKRFVEDFSDLVRWGNNRTSIWAYWEQDVIKIIKEQKRKNIERLLQDVVIRPLQLEDHSISLTGKVLIGYVVSSEQNVSQLLADVLNRYPEIDVSAQISIDKGSVSLRSRGNVDVAAIAKMFGGGGHRAASGHQLPKNLTNMIIQEVHDLRICDW